MGRKPYPFKVRVSFTGEQWENVRRGADLTGLQVAAFVRSSAVERSRTLAVMGAGKSVEMAP